MLCWKWQHQSLPNVMWIMSPITSLSQYDMLTFRLMHSVACVCSLLHWCVTNYFSVQSYILTFRLILTFHLSFFGIGSFKKNASICLVVKYLFVDLRAKLSAIATYYCFSDCIVAIVPVWLQQKEHLRVVVQEMVARFQYTSNVFVLAMQGCTKIDEQIVVASRFIWVLY